ncbi:MAG: RNA methyltransferase [Thermoplasmatota archaeon]
MTRLKIILVEPKTPGNIGAIARVMKNFGFNDLVLINPPEIDSDARVRAMHAEKVLDDAVIEDDLREALEKYDMVIGTSGIETDKEKRFIRQASSPRELASDLSGYEGRVAIVFGREDHGLSNEELNLCDKLVRIPTSEEYPIMNLSHAVSVILYELYLANLEKTGDEEVVYEKSTKSERERLISSFSDLLQRVDYPQHKHRKAVIMFRRLLGRATTTKWEYHRLMGIVNQINRELDREIDR